MLELLDKMVHNFWHKALPIFLKYSRAMKYFFLRVNVCLSNWYASWLLYISHVHCLICSSIVSSQTHSVGMYYTHHAAQENMHLVLVEYEMHSSPPRPYPLFETPTWIYQICIKRKTLVPTVHQTFIANVPVSIPYIHFIHQNLVLLFIHHQFKTERTLLLQQLPFIHQIHFNIFSVKKGNVILLFLKFLFSSISRSVLLTTSILIDCVFVSLYWKSKSNNSI